MIDTLLLPHYQKWIKPIIERLDLKRNITPNRITTLALSSGIVAGCMLWFKCLIAAFIVLLISGICDVLDGALARQRDLQSSWGCAYDIVGDRIVEVAVILGLYAFSPHTRATLCLFMLASALLCLTSFFVVGMMSQNSGQKSFHYSLGIVERFECFLLFFAMIIFPKYFSVLALVFILLVSLTAVIRMWQFYKIAERY